MLYISLPKHGIDKKKHERVIRPLSVGARDGAATTSTASAHGCAEQRKTIVDNTLLLR